MAGAPNSTVAFLGECTGRTSGEVSSLYSDTDESSDALSDSVEWKIVPLYGSDLPDLGIDNHVSYLALPDSVGI